MIGGGDPVANRARGFTEGRSILLTGFFYAKDHLKDMAIPVG